MSGLHRPEDGDAFEGDEAETMVAETLPVRLPEPENVNISMLDMRLRVKATGPMVVAVALHGVVFAAALILPRFFETKTPLRKPILARMVAQGKPRDQKLMPRKEEPPPAAAAPRVAPSVPAPAAPGPLAHPLPAPKLASARPAPAAPRQPSRQELMQRALQGVTHGIDKVEHARPPDEEREGVETGSPEGTAASAEEGDAYFTSVQNAILANYILPSIISERERMSLKATIVAWIARDGSIVKYSFEKRSGNPLFDDALELAIKRTKVPPPPEDRAKQIRDEGVALLFTP